MTLKGIDFRGIPTHECPVCQSRLFKVYAMFEDYDIALWGVDAECAECEAKVTVPCPVDAPEYKALHEE
jgi:hypothetical protein